MKQLMTRIFISTLMMALTGFAANPFQEGSPKTWPQSRVDRFYNALKKQAAVMDRPIPRSAVLSGNQIRTLVFDFGSIGAPGREPSLEWPIYSYHGYGYEFGPLVGVEVPVDTNGYFLPYVNDGNGNYVIDETNPLYDTTYYIINDGLLDGGAPGASEELSPDNEPWGWQPLDNYANPASESIPLSHKPDTWPPMWNNQWPGTYKANAATADQAMYYLMDDRYNLEFPFKPFPDNHSIGGMGLEVEVRAYQWSNPVANDAIFFVYEITNKSPNDYEKVVFGMFGDPHIGGSNDFSDDMAYFDTDINMVYGYDGDDKGEWGGITGWLGYTFLESPGNSYDGIDNDGDGLVDESMFNGIDDDGDWDPDVHDVGIDGIGPEDPKYPGPDKGEGDGVPTAGDPYNPIYPGEPNFDGTDLDEADQIGLTSFNAYQYGADMIRNDASIWRRMRPYTLVGMDNAFTDIQQRTDNIFLYGSGYFPLKSGDTQRFSIALILGENEYDLFQTAKVVQRIYNSGYQFAKAPEKPNVSVVPGDGKVTLYWDDMAEKSWDPVYGYDFQGYAIYRSTDPGFNEVHTITDNNGIATLWEPIARFDLKDGIHGESYVGINGIHYNLGTDSGLRHQFVDTTVTNGVTYYYAVCSYDIGDTTGTIDIPPSECTKIIDKDPYTGLITFDVNTGSATPSAPSPGIIDPGLTEEGMTHVGPGTGDIEIEILYPEQVRDQITYRITFGTPTSNVQDTVMFVTEMTPITETITIEDSIYYQLNRSQIGDVTIKANGLPIPKNKYHINRALGRVYSMAQEYWNQTLEVTYYHQPVFENKYFNLEDAATVFDGMRIFTKDEAIALNKEETGWLMGETNYLHKVQIWDLGQSTQGFAHPRIYELHWDEKYLETPTLFNQKAPFIIQDVTYAYKDSITNAPFYIVGGQTFNIDQHKIGILSEPELKIENKTWEIKFTPPAGQDKIPPSNGDVFRVTVNQPFSNRDTLWFTTQAAEYEPGTVEDPLDKIAVVPNPYRAQAIWEPKSAFASGRGDRIIKFINLPPVCTIRIYTITGELVNTLHHNSSMWDGSENYNLLNKDNMELAFGMYLWHVDASASGLGTKIGKFAVIK